MEGFIAFIVLGAIGLFLVVVILQIVIGFLWHFKVPILVFLLLSFIYFFGYGIWNL